MMRVAPEPMVRMELTASPTSRSRESTTPSMGETMVALRRSSSVRDTTARACSRCASDLVMAARATPRLPMADCWRFFAIS